jgi:hypothetical protein
MRRRRPNFRSFGMVVWGLCRASESGSLDEWIDGQVKVLYGMYCTVQVGKR